MVGKTDDALRTYLELSILPKIRTKELMGYISDLMKIYSSNCCVHESLVNKDEIGGLVYDMVEERLHETCSKMLTDFEQEIFSQYIDVSYFMDVVELLVDNQTLEPCACTSALFK